MRKQSIHVTARSHLSTKAVTPTAWCKPYCAFILITLIMTVACSGKPTDNFDAKESDVQGSVTYPSESATSPSASFDAPKSQPVSPAPTPLPGSYRIYLRPVIGNVGDVMPYYENGVFNVFHLSDYRRLGVRSVDIALTTTVDFTEYSPAVKVIEEGESYQVDYALGTGSIIKDKEGRYHYFYTGFNGTVLKKPQQGVMHAISDDMIKWKKQHDLTFYAPEDYTERTDFRDPNVIYIPERNEYWMTVSARKDYTAVIMLYTSTDLYDWKLHEPLYEPREYGIMECTDLFKLGDKWYLIFSSEWTMHYRVADSPDGPWETPAVEQLDGHAFYAAKTGGDSEKSYIMGWVPIKNPPTDGGGRDWGGNLAVHELLQRPDGTLVTSLPRIMENRFGTADSPVPVSLTGDAIWENGTLTLDSSTGLAGAVFGRNEGALLIDADITLSGNGRYAGFAVGIPDNEPFSKSLGVNINARERRLDFVAATLDYLRIGIPASWSPPVDIEENQAKHVQILLENDICTVYYAEEASLTARIYKMTNANWGFYALEGQMQISNLTVRLLP